MSLPLRKATLRRLKNYLRQVDKVKTLAEKALVVDDDWPLDKEPSEQTAAKPKRKDGTDAQTPDDGEPSLPNHLAMKVMKVENANISATQDSDTDPNDSLHNSSPEHSDDDTESPGTTAPSTPVGTRPSSPTSDKSKHSSSSSENSSTSNTNGDGTKPSAPKGKDDEQWMVRRSELEKLRQYHKALTTITGSLNKGISRVYAAEDEVFNRRYQAARVSEGRWPVPLEVKRQANAWAYDGRSPLHLACTVEEWLWEEEEEARQQAWMDNTGYDYEYRWDSEDNWDDEGRRVHKI